MTNQTTRPVAELTVDDIPIRPASARVREFGSRYYLQIAVAVLLIVLCVAVPNFASVGNLQNITQQASFAGLIACGMTLLIAGGLFDLSVAGITAVAAIVTGVVLPYTSIGIAAFLGVCAGVLLGILNGLVVTKIRVPPFIATFGMYNIYIAIAFIITSGSVFGIQSINFQNLSAITVVGVPAVFLLFVFICVLSSALMWRTRFGRQLRAVGSNEVAARMAGIPVDRVKITAFALTGLFTGFGAVALASLLSSAAGDMATGIELSAITIAVVGGTALRGGSGTLLGTFTGAIFITAVNDALNLTGVSSYWQNVSVGAILVLTLIIGSLARRRSAIRGTE